VYLLSGKTFSKHEKFYIFRFFSSSKRLLKICEAGVSEAWEKGNGT
jgi:hypothetical protein